MRIELAGIRGGHADDEGFLLRKRQLRHRKNSRHRDYRQQIR